MKPTERDPLWCPPSALVACPEIEEPTKGSDVKPLYKGLIVDYGVCAFKQLILADCINKYEAKEKGAP